MQSNFLGFLEAVPLAAETPESLQSTLEQCEQEDGELCLAVRDNHLTGVVLSFPAAHVGVVCVMGHDALSPANLCWEHREPGSRTQEFILDSPSGMKGSCSVQTHR